MQSSNESAYGCCHTEILPRIKFLQPTLSIYNGFWQALTKAKVNVWKYSEKPLGVVGTYEVEHQQPHSIGARTAGTNNKQDRKNTTVNPTIIFDSIRLDENSFVDADNLLLNHYAQTTEQGKDNNAAVSRTSDDDSLKGSGDDHVDAFLSPWVSSLTRHNEERIYPEKEKEEILVSGKKDVLDTQSSFLMKCKKEQHGKMYITLINYNTVERLIKVNKRKSLILQRFGACNFLKPLLFGIRKSKSPTLYNYDTKDNDSPLSYNLWDVSFRKPSLKSPTVRKEHNAGAVVFGTNNSININEKNIIEDKFFSIFYLRSAAIASRLINTCFMCTYANIKEYTYSYIFAFPALDIKITDNSSGVRNEQRISNNSNLGGIFLESFKNVSSCSMLFEDLPREQLALRAMVSSPTLGTKIKEVTLPTDYNKNNSKPSFHSEKNATSLTRLSVYNCILLFMHHYRELLNGSSSCNDAENEKKGTNGRGNFFTDNISSLPLFVVLIEEKTKGNACSYDSGNIVNLTFLPFTPMNALLPHAYIIYNEQNSYNTAATACWPLRNLINLIRVGAWTFHACHFGSNTPEKTFCENDEQELLHLNIITVCNNYNSNADKNSGECHHRKNNNENTAICDVNDVHQTHESTSCFSCRHFLGNNANVYSCRIRAIPQQCNLIDIYQALKALGGLAQHDGKNGVFDEAERRSSASPSLTSSSGVSLRFVGWSSSGSATTATAMTATQESSNDGNEMGMISSSSSRQPHSPSLRDAERAITESIFTLSLAKFLSADAILKDTTLLNIRLMKWRALPELDIDVITGESSLVVTGTNADISAMANENATAHAASFSSSNGEKGNKGHERTTREASSSIENRNRVLLIGSGSLGCVVARNLLMWGVAIAGEKREKKRSISENMEKSKNVRMAYNSQELEYGVNKVLEESPEVDYDGGLTSSCITFIDNSNVNCSNLVRQVLFVKEDVEGGSTWPSDRNSCCYHNKAFAAKRSISRVLPSACINCVKLSVPMPGHFIGNNNNNNNNNLCEDLGVDSNNDGDTREIKKLKQSILLLNRLINDHDIVFLLTDTREARWLPALLCSISNTNCITAAVGFDSFLAMRHGKWGQNLSEKGNSRKEKSVATSNTTRRPQHIKMNKEPAATVTNYKLGCYFCNDVTVPTDTSSKRAMDKRCTVTRPGCVSMAGSLAVELAISLLQHPLKFDAPAIVMESDVGGNIFSSRQVEEWDGEEPSRSPHSCLGILAHQIRGSLGNLGLTSITGRAFQQCVCCSYAVRNKCHLPLIAPSSSTDERQPEKCGLDLDFIVAYLMEPEILEKMLGLTVYNTSPDQDDGITQEGQAERPIKEAVRDTDGSTSSGIIEGWECL